jgi:hypothetical protein
LLRDANADKRWGEINLLGRSPEGWPVIIELKGASSTEPPLRGIVEGVAFELRAAEGRGVRPEVAPSTLQCLQSRDRAKRRDKRVVRGRRRHGFADSSAPAV